jgi:hypothetical protein
MCSVRQRPMPRAPNGVGELCLIRQVCVSADAEAPHFVGPLEDLAEAAIDIRLLRIELPVDHLSISLGFDAIFPSLISPFKAIERNELPFLDHLAVDGELLVLSPKSSTNRRRRSTACPSGVRRPRRATSCRRCRQDALRDVHAVNVVRNGLFAGRG